jgi:hypothetical protein
MWGQLRRLRRSVFSCVKPRRCERVDVPDRAVLRTYRVVVDRVKSGLGGVQRDSNQRLM